MCKLIIFPACSAALLACSVSSLVWLPSGPTSTPLFRFREGGKIGYINASGAVVIPASFTSWLSTGGEFNNGLALVDSSNSQFIDTKGNVVITNPLYGSAWSFSDGLAAVADRGTRRWGFIDPTGRLAIPLQFEQPSSFSEGLAAITSGEQVGFVDKTGKYAFERQFLKADEFHEGMARVVVSGACVFYEGEGPCSGGGQVVPGSAYRRGVLPLCKFSFVDKTGKVLGATFDQAKEFSEGLAPAMLEDKWGYIDKTGTWVIPAMFSKAEPFSEGMARVSNASLLYGYINRAGRNVIPFIYKNASDFRNGLASVTEGSGYSYIKTNGELAFPGRFAYGGPFLNGLASVLDSSPYGSVSYINTYGTRVFTFGGWI